MTANAIHTTDEGELLSLLLNQFKASLFRAVIVTNEGAIGLFHGEHMEQASRGMNLELSRVTSAATIRDARCAEFDEVLGMSHSMEGDGVYWDHIFSIVELSLIARIILQASEKI